MIVVLLVSIVVLVIRLVYPPRTGAGGPSLLIISFSVVQCLGVLAIIKWLFVPSVVGMARTYPDWLPDT